MSEAIERLRERLDRQQPLKVTPDGRIVLPNAPEKGTIIKENKWYAVNLERLRERLDRQQPLKVNQYGEIVDPDSPEKGTIIKENKWYVPWWKQNSGRLVLEYQIMKDRYPQFELKEVDGQLVWHGALRSNRGNYYEVAIVYPDNFPHEAPKAYIIEPKITRAKHMFADGHLCLFAPWDRSWEEKTTAATVVTWVAAWIFAYETWLETGYWPGKSAD